MTEECNPRQLSTLLKKGLKVLTDMDHRKLFRALPAPNEPWAPAYRQTIKNLIDLNTIGNRMGKKGYTHNDFLADVQLLYENTRTFNGSENEITSIARQFVEETKKFIDQHREVRVTVGSYR